jgi:Carbamoyltransferase C-terminus
MPVAGAVRQEWRAKLPAVVHVDGSTRPQAVNSETNRLYHQLLTNLNTRDGMPGGQYRRTYRRETNVPTRSVRFPLAPN